MIEVIIANMIDTRTSSANILLTIISRKDPLPNLLALTLDASHRINPGFRLVIRGFVNVTSSMITGRSGHCVWGVDPLSGYTL